MNTQGPKVSHETKSSDGKDKIKGPEETTHGYKKNKTKWMVLQFSQLQYDVSIFF